MALTLDAIKRAAVTPSYYQEGQELYQSKAAKIESCQSFWKGEVTIKGTVTEQAKRYRVEFTLSEGDFSGFTCHCGKCCRGFCRHLCAAAIAYYHLIQQNPAVQANTSPLMQQLLKDYTNQSIDRMLAEDNSGDVFLEPLLHCNSDKQTLTFKIGSGKKSYVLKDLTEFYYAMKHGEQKEYGKNLAFVHARWSFRNESLPLLDFMIKAMERRLHYFRVHNPFRLETMMKDRELKLHREEIDEFFSIYMGRSIQLERFGEPVCQLEVSDGNPSVKVEITEYGNGGCRLNLVEQPDVFFGGIHLYIRNGKTIYRCDEQYSKDMKNFYFAAGKRYGELVVGKRDMPALCGQFLPIVERYIQLETDVDLESYVPKQVESEFFFDLDEENRVICTETLKYNEFSFNPIAGKSVPLGICRDYPGEYRIRRLVEKYFTYYDTDAGQLILEKDEEIYRLIEDGMEEFMAIGKVFLSEAFRQVKITTVPSVAVGVSLQGNLLELTIDAGGLSEQELKELLENYKRKKKYYRLRSGEFVKIEGTSLLALSELAEGLRISGKDIQNGKVMLPAYRAMYIEQVLAETGRTNQWRDKNFKQLIRNLKNIEDSDFEVPQLLKSTLRGYQKMGYRWLKTLSSYGFCGILADDMGLGKTIQVITLLTQEQEHLYEKPALIICPASLVFNWENEIRRFSADLSVMTISGNAQERNEFLSSDIRYQVWITSYDLIKRDITWYEGKEFSYQIIDEAQVIKNFSTQSAKAVKQIQAKHRFALTGTPIENRLSELWSIFDYLMPGFLYSYSKFREELELPIAKEQEESARLRLKRMVGPFILRRLKSDVLKELPEKIEEIIYAKMEGEQKALYAASASKLKNELAGQAEEDFKMGKIRILAELTRLRQLCCDPHLCFENYEGESAKLETCMELISEGLEGGHKILLFSQFTTMLDRIRGRLEEQGVKSYTIVGQTPKKERVDLAERFNNDDVGIFLISLKAGGTGLNLTGADMVIHYDPWWNLAVQNQATDRAHRIGQKHTVHVVKLIAKYTIEENIVKLQESKRQLADQIIGGEDMGFGALGLADVMDLLD